MIDLHMHSVCSDGTDDPAALPRLALASGLTAVALTDHDTTAGNAAFAAALDELCEARSTEVAFVPGCEISCLHTGTGRSTHVLCYFVEDGETPLQSVLTGLREDRDKRNERLVERLHDLGYDVERSRIEELAEKPLEKAGRPHFAKALLEAHPAGTSAPRVADGLPRSFSSIQEVFNGLLGNDGPAYIPKAKVTPGEAAAAAASSGALAVLAHPTITFCSPEPGGAALSVDEKERRLEPIVEQLAADGLAGLEVYYSRHSPEETAMLRRLAGRHGLVATGGSDYHGVNKVDLEVGIGMRAARGTDRELRVPDDVLDQLRARRRSS